MERIADDALERLSALCGPEAEELSNSMRLVGDRFELQRSLGGGGMADVYRAIDRASGAAVAIKLFRPRQLDVARFEREANALRQLHHDGIVEYLTHGITDAGEPYLAMELIEGCTLSSYLHRAVCTLADATVCAQRVAESLAFAHEHGIVHRDLKPENIVLRQASILDPVLVDFGLALRRGAGGTLTTSGLVIGTPGYMAPEQARAAHDVDARADVFALGCVLYECITGRAAFPGDDYVAVLTKILFEEPLPVDELSREVPRALADLIARMLMKDPSRRPRDGAAVVRALSSLPRDPSAQNRDVLTRDEQRVVALILVTGALEAYAAARGDWSEEDEPTLTTEDAEEMFAHLHATTRPFGAVLETLADGSLAATFAGGEEATDLALRAARCAIALRTTLPLSPIVLTMGSAKLDGRMPLGSVIDRAAALARDGGSMSFRPAQALAVRIDELTADLLGSRAGIRRGDDALELLGQPAETDAPRTLLGRPAPFVGRDVELAMLRTTFEACSSERSARAVIVTAAAGAGKSRLSAEFLNELRERDAEVWTARGDPLTAGSPLAIAARVLASAVGLQAGEPPAVARHKIISRVGRHFTTRDVLPIAEFLGELVSASFPDDHRPQLRTARHDPLLMGDEVRAAWQDWVRAECAARPVVIAIDDLHWGDSVSIRLFDTALRASKDSPLMIVALGRPELHTSFPRLWEHRTTSEIRLGPLSAGAGATLVREVLGERASPATTRWVIDHADGNPLFFEELIRAASEGNLSELPGTLTTMVQTRLQALEPDLRRVLRAASIHGEVFSESGLRALLGGGRELDFELDKLIEVEAIQRRSSGRFGQVVEYAFRHPLLREAAYAMLTERDLEVGHRMAGDWLEHHGSDDPIVLAEHFEQSDEPRRAIEWFRRAAEQALDAHDFETATQRVDRAVECGAAGEILGRLRLIQSECHRWSEQLPLSLQRGVEALSLLPRGSSDWFIAMRTAFKAAAVLNERDQRTRLFEVLLAVSKEAPLNLYAVRAVCGAILDLHDVGELGAAAPLLEQLDSLAPSIVDPMARATYLFTRAMLAWAAGDISESFALHDAYTDDGTMGRYGCLTRANAALVYMAVGYYEKAEHELSMAVAAAERFDVRPVLGVAKHIWSIALGHLGAIERATALEHEVLDLLSGTRSTRGEALIHLAHLGWLTGNLSDAERHAAMAIELFAEHPRLNAEAQAVLARVFLAAGRPQEALALMNEATRELAGCDAQPEVLIRLVHAEALEAAGRHDEACQAIAMARDRLLERAAKLRDAAHRDSFLKRVPNNARTLALAGAWLDSSQA